VLTEIQSLFLIMYSGNIKRMFIFVELILGWRIPEYPQFLR